MILGALAANTGFQPAALLGMLPDDARFWWNALAAYQERVRAEAE